MNRREFMKTGALAGVTTALGTGISPGKKQGSANDRIAVGVIGSGARAQQLMEASMALDGVEIVAVCDAYSGRVKRAVSRTGERAKVYENYQQMLAEPDIDVVIIGTPDHWHRQMAVESMEAGKDVYVEKPMTYAIEEGLEIIDAVKRTNRILQVGSQGMSSQTQQTARQLVQDGKLGQITMIRASYNRNTASGAWIYPIPPDATRKTVDWEAFLGSAPKRPFDLARFFQWRCYWDYSGGIATDLFVHLVTSIHYIMGAKMPSSVVASGQLYRWKDTREVPDTLNAVLVYPEGFSVNLSSTFNNQSSAESGFEILGTEGSLSFRGGSLEFRPENVWEDNRWVVDSWERQLEEAYYNSPEVKAQESPWTWDPKMNLNRQQWEEQGISDTQIHLAHFYDSVRTRKPPVQDALMGHRAASCAHLINLSLKQNRVMEWDFNREVAKA